MNESIKKRLKSLAWRAGCVALVAGLNEAGKYVGVFDLPPIVQTLIGLAVGEATKWLNTHTDMFGGALKKQLPRS